MSREEVLNKIQNYFIIQELVDERTYNKHKENAWQFFSTDLLTCLLIIRKNLGRKITVNNWFWGGRFSQRGLRTNLSYLINKSKLYLSAHLMGKAVDFDVEGMTAEEVRNLIEDNADLFPCKIRLEHFKNGKPINWVHLDIFSNSNNPKIYKFNV